MEIDGKIMESVTFADVKVGDTILCRTMYAVVQSRHTYEAGEPRSGPVGIGFAAVELRTVHGARWGAPSIPMSTYKDVPK